MPNIAFQLKRGLDASWNSTNPILKDGEPGLNSTDNTIKIGNGTNTWVLLPIIGNTGVTGTTGPTGATGPTGIAGTLLNTGPAGPTGTTVTRSTTAMLTGTTGAQNTTVTPSVIPGFTFTLASGKTATLDMIAMYRTPVATTGPAFAFRVTQDAGADTNVLGSAVIAISSDATPSPNAIIDGDIFNVGPGANSLFEVLNTSGNTNTSCAWGKAILQNTATVGAGATITVEFRSEVAGSGVFLDVGTCATFVVL